MDHSIIAALIIATSNVALFLMQAHVSKKLSKNTELTLQIEKSTNSMKDALVAATDIAGRAQGALDERSRADAEKKE